MDLDIIMLDKHLGDAVREITEQLKNINKNLEKIANKDCEVIKNIK